MLKFLRRRSVATAPEPLYRHGYSQWGFATHILVDGDTQQALCGRRIVKLGHVTEPAFVRADIANQHENFFYCADCASQFAGVERETVLAGRETHHLARHR